MTQARIPTDWNPASWQTRPAAQQPTYKDRAALDSAVSRLSALPPLVTSWEIERLQERARRGAQRGERVPAAGRRLRRELRRLHVATTIAQKLKILLQMSLVLVARHARSRSSASAASPASTPSRARADIETRDGVTLPAYRGDIINRAGVHGRRPRARSRADAARLRARRR